MFFYKTVQPTQGNFSVSGGESIYQRPPSRTPGATEVLTRMAQDFFYFYVLPALTGYRYKNAHKKPDAVKIFITDCPSSVKRNSFPSTRNPAPLAYKCEHAQNSLDYNTKSSLPSIVPHRMVSFFCGAGLPWPALCPHWSETPTVLLSTPPCLRVSEMPSPGGVVVGITTFT